MYVPAKLARLGTGRVAALFVGVAILAMAIAIGVWATHEREQTIRQGFRVSANLARVLQAQVAGAVRGVDLTLSHVADTLRLIPPLPEHDPAFENSMRQKLSQLRFVRALFVVGPDGYVAQDTDHPFAPRRNLSDRPYFTAHVENPAAGLHIGRPLPGRAVGTWLMSFSRRIDRPDGGFGGIVVAAVEIQDFALFYRTLELSPRDSLALFLRDGTLLLRTPDIKTPPGQSCADLPLFRTHLPANVSGSFRSTGELDDVPRIVSYRALDRYPLVVAVTLSEEGLLADWRRQVTSACGAGLAFAIALIALTLAFVRARKRYEALRERQSQAQRLETLGRMTGGMAHDVNNLLGVIASGTRLLKRSDRLNADSVARILTELSDAVTQGRALMSRLLAFARSEELELHIVDINERIRSLKPLLRQAVDQKTKLAIEPAADVWPCRLDPVHLDAAMLNLVVNARDAMPDGGGITITTRNVHLPDPVGPGTPAGDYVEVCVTDTGIGMAPDVARRAIEPFFTTKPGTGTGLGLSQVHGFVRRVGGDLRIETRPGAGTSIRLLFPRAADSSDSARPRATGGEEADTPHRSRAS